jgi:arginine repressor
VIGEYHNPSYLCNHMIITMEVLVGANKDAKSRRAALKKLLEVGIAPSQEEICNELLKQGFEVTQSTISRDLRLMGSVRIVDAQGQTIYQFPNLAKVNGVTDSAI